MLHPKNWSITFHRWPHGDWWMKLTQEEWRSLWGQTRASRPSPSPSSSSWEQPLLQTLCPGLYTQYHRCPHLPNRRHPSAIKTNNKNVIMINSLQQKNSIPTLLSFSNSVTKRQRPNWSLSGISNGFPVLRSNMNPRLECLSNNGMPAHDDRCRTLELPSLSWCLVCPAQLCRNSSWRAGSNFSG